MGRRGVREHGAVTLEEHTPRGNLQVPPGLRLHAGPEEQVSMASRISQPPHGGQDWIILSTRSAVLATRLRL